MTTGPPPKFHGTQDILVTGADQAFSRTVETSVCVDPAATWQGHGPRLYDELLRRLAGQDVHVVLAGVAIPKDASVRLHLSRGFREVGTFTEYATKHGRFISSTWLEKVMP